MRAIDTPLNSVETKLLTEPKIHTFSVGARWLTEGDCRLDASLYDDEVLAARRVIVDSGFKVKLLGKPDVTREIFNLPRFKRIYTDDLRKGWPYLSASEAFMFRPESNRWIARDKAPAQAEHHFAKAGWILVTCSGVVGRCVLVAKRLETYFLTHDLLRVVPVLPAGYLYAFLSTWMGQALMVKEQYGGTITHLEPHHLQGIPVPLLPEDEQQGIHEQIMKAYRLRDKANDLLDQADELLHTELGLPRFDESKASYLGGVKSPKAFVVKASELAERLDASFHLPVAKAAIQQLREGKYPLVRLGDVAQHIFMPPTYKRVYVKPEHGLPILSGSHLIQRRPIDLKFISPIAFDRTPVENYRIRAGWILVTGRGTTGLPCLVPSKWDGWLASHNILRVIVNAKIHGGYVFAFLASSYGSSQMTAKQLGAVVNVLTPQDLSTIFLPDAPPEVQQRIGNLVVQAFEKKEAANQIEEQAINTLEKTITKSR